MEGKKEMTKHIVKALNTVAVSVLVLVSTTGATRAPSMPPGAPSQEECTYWEDWYNIRYFGLWSDKYHIPSSPDFNPHEESRWWRPKDIFQADGRLHDLLEGLAKNHGHGPCGGQF